ncbi:hypothetical protein GCM10018980_51730 [Streptomyces capoamus]|uniref:DUF7736 domain-containing protein n=1 Tax=Streptomyces capoamus TaxID=68183 RepID=A0A919KDG6_9ACTN|nr:hypothetical protein [Streptomyces capoamus]GGW15763.1 hypothetical protein GCM10010501_29080 [Streptomyces libani subsp. rufus]GHG62089.1 hypothetical protein GCM10018980_51730 [Streptomyces capoamus]
MTDSRAFALADVLSVTTEKLLSRRHMDGIYDILSYMTGQSLFTPQLPDACDKAKPALLEQHPQLVDVCPPDGLDRHDLLAWLTEAERVHGETLDVQPLTDWQHRDPIEDACDKVGAEKVYVVPVPPKD